MLNLMRTYNPDKISNHSFMWKIKSTPGFIIMVSLITLVGITGGSIFPVGPIQAQQTPIFPQGNDVPSQPTGTGDIASQNIDPEDLYFNMDGKMSSFITTP